VETFNTKNCASLETGIGTRNSIKETARAVAAIRGVIGVIYPPPLESWGVNTPPP